MGNKDFVIEEGRLLRYNGPRERHIRIPDGVKEIGDDCFSYRRELESIYLPYGLEIIGKWAFSDCDKLENFVLPSTLREIRYGAFNGCWKLHSLRLPDTMEELGPFAFQNCVKLKKIEIPERTHLENFSTFTGCRYLNRVKVSPNSPYYHVQGPLILSGDEKTILYCQKRCDGEIRVSDGVEAIAPCAFSDCDGLERVYLPDSVRSIGDWAFEGCLKMTRIRLPASLEYMGGWIFDGCEKLESLSLPEGVIQLGRGMLRSCYSLRHLRLPSTLEIIGPDAFDVCFIRKLVIPSSVKRFRSTMKEWRGFSLTFQGPVPGLCPNTLALSERAELILDWYPFWDLDDLHRNMVANGVLRRLAEDEPIDDNVQYQACSWVRDHAEDFWQERSFRDVMVRYELIPSWSYEAILDSAYDPESHSSPELLAALLNYPEQHFSQEERERLERLRFAL